jgi:hypothetical protein
MIIFCYFTKESFMSDVKNSGPGFIANRRQLLTRAGMIGAAAVGSSLLGFGKRNLVQAALETNFGPKGHKVHVNDVDILNFALNLEYLEAEFYQRAAFGIGLSAADTSGSGKKGAAAAGTVTGGSAVPFSSSIIAQYASEIATDELNHVQFLRDVLGKNAVAEPTIDLVTSFTNAAIAAGVITAGETFDPFANDANFLLGAFIFEDVGVTAYHGAAPYITKDVYLEAAAGILAVEAYHAGEIRTLLFSMGQDTPSLITAANQISALRNSASAAASTDPSEITDEGITNSDGTANIIPADDNSIAFSRTFAEVLNIVYLGGAAGGFGFFPDQLNGRIK